MLYPNVTEIARAGSPSHPFPRTQRAVVALSLRLKPDISGSTLIERDRRRGTFR